MSERPKPSAVSARERVYQVSIVVLLGLLVAVYGWSDRRDIVQPDMTELQGRHHAEQMDASTGRLLHALAKALYRVPPPRSGSLAMHRSLVDALATHPNISLAVVERAGVVLVSSNRRFENTKVEQLYRSQTLDRLLYGGRGHGTIKSPTHWTVGATLNDDAGHAAGTVLLRYERQTRSASPKNE